MSIYKKVFGAGKVSGHHSYIRIDISNRQLSGEGGGGIFAVIFPFTDNNTSPFCLWNNSHQLQAK